MIFSCWIREKEILFFSGSFFCYNVFFCMGNLFIKLLGSWLGDISLKRAFVSSCKNFLSLPASKQKRNTGKRCWEKSCSYPPFFQKRPFPAKGRERAPNHLLPGDDLTPAVFCKPVIFRKEVPISPGIDILKPILKEAVKFFCYKDFGILIGVDPCQKLLHSLPGGRVEPGVIIDLFEAAHILHPDPACPAGEFRAVGGKSFCILPEGFQLCKGDAA